MASDGLKGRFTGSKGANKAAQYGAADFGHLGLQQLNGSKRFLSEFTYIAGTEVDKKNCSLDANINGKKQIFSIDSDFVPCSFTLNGKIEGEVVFVDYGIKTPDKSTVEYNSYAKVNVKDKIVLVIDGIPDSLSDDDRKTLVRYSSLRYKALVARELGAKAILFIDATGNGLGFSAQDNTPANSGIIAEEVKTSFADALLKAKVPR